jgi:hypothetical protein
MEGLILSLRCYLNESDYSEHEDTGENSCNHCEYLYYASITLRLHLELNFPIEFIALTW